MLRVLFVSPVVPWPLDSGGRMRTFQLLRSLRGRAEVHLRAVLEPGQDAAALQPLAAHCASVLGFERMRPSTWQRWTRAKIERWFHSPALVERLAREIESRAFDLVHLDELLLVRMVAPDSPTRVVVHHHKLDTLLHEYLPSPSRLHRMFDVWKLYRLEFEAARLFRHHVLTSEVDARILRSRHPDLELAVVESGFDPEHLSPAPKPPERGPDELLFVGSLAYAPNVDAVRRFVHQILPRIRAVRPAARLTVVGGEPPDEVLSLAGDGVAIEGLVAEVKPYLERCALFVAPLHIGGGTRLKLVEALAMEAPVVSTRAGAEGLALIHDEHLLLADDPEAFARATLALLDDRPRAERLARAGRERVNQLYRWNDLADRLVAFWESSARSAPSATSSRPRSR